MLKEERRQRVIQILEAEGSVKVSDLARRLSTSRATIWRDIDELSADGRVEKVHGGARLAARHEAHADVDRQLETVTPQTGLRIGMQVPDGSYYFPPVIAGARKACELAGGTLVTMNSSYDPGAIADTIATLCEAEVDGLLLSPRERTAVTLPEGVDLPYVLVEREFRGIAPAGLRSVSTAHEAGLYTAVEHLIALGHQRIGLVATSSVGGPRRRIVEAWQTATRALLAGSDGHAHEWIGHDLDVNIDQIKRAGATAVICMNDTVAALLLRALRQHGMSVPGDLSLISYDDEIAENLRPPLTAISPDREAVGFMAAQQLLTRLSGSGAGHGRRIRIDPTLVVRESTAPPRA